MKAERLPSGATMIGFGSALPDKVVTNADLEVRLDTSDDWIIERTGIRERRIGGTTSGLAAEAGRRAMQDAGVGAEDIDAVILATTTPDQVMPQTASTVQDQLGIRGGAFDLNAACSGFVYGLVVAHGLVAVGMERVLLIGAETLSTIVDWEDRTTAVIFADGAGAAVVERTDGPGELLGFDLGSDGSGRHLITADHGGYLRMEGREVYRQAVRIVVDSARAALDRAGVDATEIELVIPHQANIRIIEAATSRLGIPMERTVDVLSWTGNTSAASIPIAIVAARDEGRLHPGAKVLVCGFGAGMGWATAVLDWGAP